jgi:hypothetical protein
MPTENRRIATYFPKGVDEKFTAFKIDRGIRGDSQALLTIVSEFLGVNQEVAHSSSPDFLDRFKSLEKIVFQIQQELEQLRSLPRLLDDKEFEEPTEQAISVVPGQLSFLEPITVGSHKDSLSPECGHVTEGVDGWISMKNAWADLGTPGHFDTFRKRTPDQLREMYGLEVFSYSKGKYKRHLVRRVTGIPSSEDF